MFGTVIRKLVFGAALGLTVVGVVPAREAQAEGPCLDSCTEDYPGGDPISLSARGWCMILRCFTLEP